MITSIGKLMGGSAGLLLRGIPRSRIAIVLVLSGLGGLFEAGLLILIVQIATQATGGSAARSSTSGGVMSALLGNLTIMQGVLIGTLCALLSIAFQLISSQLMMRAASLKLNMERERLVRAFYSSSVVAQTKMSAGHVQDLAANGANRMAEGVFLTGQSAAAWTNLFVLLVAAFIASPWTALALVVVAAIIGAAFAPVTAAITRSSRNWALQVRGYSSFLAIYTRMFIEIRVFGVARRVESLALDGARDATESWRRGRALQQGTPIVFRNSALLLGFLCIGVVAIIAPAAVGGIAITALLLVRGLVYLQQVLGTRQSMKAMSVYAEMVDETVAELGPDTAVWGERHLGRLETLRLEGVGFDYEDGTPVFTGVDFEARRGQFVAIVGPSGGGKTTLLKLIMRTLDPSSGEVLVNGTPIEEYRQADWYSQVAYLSQEVRLVPGTIADNIRFYRDASDEQVERAALAAALELDGRAFPQGLDTVVEQEGLNLSGGQRQRIGLARCLLLNPQMLVLDEPTSALDASTEKSIMDTIAGLRENLLIVMVTHRPSTLALTDVRYRMEDGVLTRQESAPVTA
ncbi:hypothetical protein GCM10022288_11900 [Gryllotalpicola kribbensis]|jgi:ABC-type multidrug transport system fused ATPase/permease subunit|uniref:ABC transporter ATP-binding protein n=1 Tax=Gryllotalpicola kribbensis TaxID=993084 RepID=A0ABP8AP59_9MICO